MGLLVPAMPDNTNRWRKSSHDTIKSAPIKPAATGPTQTMTTARPTFRNRMFSVRVGHLSGTKGAKT
jgi:hypothetical protein